MKLTLNLDPAGSDSPTSASLDGTLLTLNGSSYDLSELPDGAIAHHADLGKVTRNGDEYECTIRLTHGSYAPYETRFPEPIILDDHSGPIDLPPYDAVLEQEEIVE